MPSMAIEFTGSSVIREFEDGWKLYDLQNAEDMDKFGGLLHNCWTGGSYGNWITKVLPAPNGEDQKALVEERARKRWDRPEYRKAYGDEWVESRIENDKKIPSERCYKLIALVDSEGNLSLGASLGLREFPNITYGGCDGLYQQRKSWIELDGFEFCVLETAPFRPSGDALDHLIGWYRDICKGEWQESLALDKARNLAAAR